MVVRALVEIDTELRTDTDVVDRSAQRWRDGVILAEVGRRDVVSDVLCRGIRELSVNRWLFDSNCRHRRECRSVVNGLGVQVLFSKVRSSTSWLVYDVTGFYLPAPDQMYVFVPFSLSIA